MVVTMEHSEQTDVLPGGADTFNYADQLLLQLCMFGLCLLLDIFRKSRFCQVYNLARKIGETAHFFIVEGVSWADHGFGKPGNWDLVINETDLYFKQMVP